MIQLIKEDGVLTREGMIIHQNLTEFISKLYESEHQCDGLALHNIISDVNNSHCQAMFDRRRKWNKKLNYWRVECAGLLPKERIRKMLSNGYMNRLELTKLYRWVFEVSLAEANRLIVELIDTNQLLKDKEGLVYMATCGVRR